MRHILRRIQRQPVTRAAFTLIEMLVSVTLVLLMMTMFTSVFQMATQSLSKQRGIAESDQKLRMLTTILRADFAKRSNRNPFPFVPGEDATSSVPFTNRQGYDYISCNNPASGQDDLIQFTADIRRLQKNTDTTRYFGRAELLFDVKAFNDGAPTVTSLPFNPNQPDADDGDLIPNGATASNAAEIALFVRNGNLIRRTMLLREPLPVSAGDLEIRPKSTSPGNNYFQPEATAGAGGTFVAVQNPNAITDATVTPPPTSWSAITTNDFWKFFDMSAVPANSANVPSGVELVGIDALGNDGSLTAPALGLPYFRFGFNPVNGLSREHENTSGTTQFLGRFLHAETSHVDFNWPIAASTVGNGNPLDVTNTPLTLNNVSGLVTAFEGSLGRGGDRRMEDVLLTGVQEFRVELWDNRLERYVVPGHELTRTYIDNAGNVQTIAGDYHILRNAQFDSVSAKITYGPQQISTALAGVPHVYDTWHPDAAASNRRNFDGDLIQDIAEQHAPYYPLKYYPPRQNGTTVRSGTVQLGPSSPLIPDPVTEYDPEAFDSVSGLLGRTNANQGVWEPGQSYTKGDVVFARAGHINSTFRGWDSDNDGVFEWIDDTNQLLSPPPLVPRQGFHIAYRCMGNTTGGNSGTSSSLPAQLENPAWGAPGKRFIDNDLIWEGFENYQPLKSVKLTIRYLDTTSQQPKQLSLIMPMTDEE